MWAAKTPNGPSVKLHVQNIHTMDELKMTGNCLKGSRGILSFDAAFDETEWGKLVKELFTHVRIHITEVWRFVLNDDDLLDIRCTPDCSESKAIRRSRPYILFARQQNMVPELPGVY